MIAINKPMIALQVKVSASNLARSTLQAELGDGLAIPPFDIQNHVFDIILYPYQKPVAVHFLSDLLLDTGIEEGDFKVAIL